MNGFIEEGIVVGGLALIPVISVLVSVVKTYWKLDKFQIALVNVIFGVVAVAIYGLVEQQLSLVEATLGAFSIAFGSKLFHDTFGHAGDAILNILGKSSTSSTDNEG